MLSWIRESFGTTVIYGIIGFIAFVFVFYGVFNPKATRGLHEGAVAGTVNGDPISIPEFNREYNRRLDFFRNIMGGKVSEDQLRSFNIRQMVFQDLVRRKLLVQEALRQSRVASDEEVKEKIAEIPAFQENGQFSLTTYKKVLEANNYSPESFEKMIREDLSQQHWSEYFKNRVHVSEEEIRKQFLLSQEKRNIKYILLTSEAGRKDVQVDSKEIQKFLSDATKVNLAKNQFEAKKDKEFKGKTFDAVKETLAKEILASEKVDEIRKINEKLADQVLPLLTADEASNSKVNALLDSYRVEVKSTDWISRTTPYLPGIGEAPELLSDAFSKKSPIDPAQGGKAKKYVSGAWVAVAILIGSQKPDLAKFEEARDSLILQIATRKERELYDAWVKNLSTKAKIDSNPAVLGREG